MKIQCHKCAQKMDVDPRYIGQTIACISCSENILIVNPNLHACPDCFGLISKRARMCPYCGSPFDNLSSPKESSAINEKTLFIGHPSAINYLGQIIIGILTIPLIIGIFILLFTILKIYYTTYTITNIRVISESGFISKSKAEIWIRDMRGAGLSQSVMQRLLRIGNIAIGTAATAGTEMLLVGVKDPQKITDLINTQRHK